MTELGMTEISTYYLLMYMLCCVSNDPDRVFADRGRKCRRISAAPAQSAHQHAAPVHSRRRSAPAQSGPSAALPPIATISDTKTQNPNPKPKTNVGVSGKPVAVGETGRLRRSRSRSPPSGIRARARSPHGRRPFFTYDNQHVGMRSDVASFESIPDRQVFCWYPWCTAAHSQSSPHSQSIRLSHCQRSATSGPWRPSDPSTIPSRSCDAPLPLSVSICHERRTLSCTRKSSPASSPPPFVDRSRNTSWIPVGGTYEIT